jgi:FlaG/FlaF family flagellin (archaellin)
MSRPLQAQRGITLVIGMILLVLLTLFVIATVSMTSLNLRTIGNTQSRNEAVGAAQQAVEQVASTDFPKDPKAVAVNVDVNGDGTTDYAVAVAKPACLNSVPIKLPIPGQPSEIDPAVVDDQACFGGISASGAGIVGGASGAGNSGCANTQWDVNATVTDNGGNGAAMTLHQGIGRRIAIGDVGC